MWLKLCRWILQCIEENTLERAPEFTREWIDISDENTMYSPSLVERILTTWEAKVCPWWIDYPMGVIPKQEIEMRESESFSFCRLSVFICVNY